MKIGRLLASAVAFLLFSLALIPGVEVASAATIRVPDDQPTIQAGIDAASDGDAVLVADGTYTGVGNREIDFKGKAITLQSENGAEGCVIDCQSDGRGFYFHQSEGYTSIISGLSIINGHVFGTDDGGGIYCYHSSPSIRNCIIRANTSDENGGGIHCYGSSPEIVGCTISSNTSKASGGGINCYSSSSATIKSCTVIGSSTCPECTGDPVILEDITFDADTNCECRAATRIEIGSSVTIQKGAKVTFRAPKIEVKPGAKIESGAVVNMKWE